MAGRTSILRVGGSWIAGAGAGLRPGRVARVGDTVRRPAGPWTSSVQGLLRFLREEGIGIVPEPRGTDAAGREVLAFIERPPGPGQAVQHGDLGPWNLLRGGGGQVAGVLDWELAGPVGPLYDTGHLAWFTVPLMDDARARARGHLTGWRA